MSDKKLVCEGCAVDSNDDDSVQLRENGQVLCENCVGDNDTSPGFEGDDDA